MANRPRGSSRPGASSSRGRGGAPRRPANPSTSRGGQAARAHGSGGSRFTTRAVILVSIVVLLLASYTSSLKTWWDQRAEIKATQAEITLREQAIAQLEEDAARWDDPAYVKQQARARFGWVLPGEVGYRVIGADGKVTAEDAPQLAEPVSAEPPQWYDKMWGSVQRAGEDPAERAERTEVPDEVLQDDQGANQ